MSEQSPPGLYVFATSKPGRAKKALAELLDLVVLSGCPSTNTIINSSRTVFAVGLTHECVKALRRLIKSRGVEELASVKLCTGPYTSAEELLRAVGESGFSVNFRERSEVFSSLMGKGRRNSALSAEVFRDMALVCAERLI